MMKYMVCCILFTTAAVAGAADSGKSATASLVDVKRNPVGTASFIAKDEGVAVTVKVSGLPPGKHGMHLHENGKCEPPGFASAGTHFNPSGKHHGSHNPQGKHAGDLPNLEVKSDGTAQLTTVIKGVSLDDAKTSLVARGGTALVIHASADDEKTDPAGNSGARIACGVVVAK